MRPDLKERWLRLLGEAQGSNFRLVERWVNEFDWILKMYAEPHRAYHTLAHIEHCLRELDEIQDSVFFDIRTLELAIWCHDVFYDTHAKDNEEKSAEFAGRLLSAYGFSPDFSEAVSLMVLDTAHAGAQIERGDSMIMHDIDLAILGQAAERFNEYEREVRVEYNWVPEEGFRSGRSAILQRFLDQPTIYLTPHFRDKYEKQARDNLSRSIKQLASS